MNNKKNCGCTFNYHNANNLAKGKYIAHIDDDDISFQNRLEKQLSFMENNDDIALSGTYIQTFGENVRPSWVFYTTSEKLDFMMNFYNPICHSSVIYRKNFVDKNAINYDIAKKCAQDYDFYKQILLRGGKLANIPEILVKYRMHLNRLTDIKETQEIQINNAAKIKKELLSRFFNEKIITEISALTLGFPFNDYSKDNVIAAINKTAVEYIRINKGFEQISNEIKNDIISNLYKF
ncbi:MAG: glycosyltransferase [Candidatus Gastranaerophilales bacterium]|nr:glycosyltransferase [Candidatus Gastranaerophilales bacterium]